MTDNQFLEILDAIKIRIGINNDEVFYNYLDTADRLEKSLLANAVSKEMGFDSKEFNEKLTVFLTIRAKPWASKKDINV